MIPGTIEVLRPDTLSEAASAHAEAIGEGLDVHFYAGSTEILSLARQGRIRPEVLIDLKSIPECREAGMDGGELVMGAALCLNEVVEADLFPLLSAAAARVADHTVRNRLSLGGNIAGRLPYRETVLPLLAAEAEAELYGPEGWRRLPLRQVFSRRLNLSPGELLVRVRVSAEAAAAPWYHGRRERGTRVDYPLVTVCLLEARAGLALGISGACGYPLGPGELQAALEAGLGDSANQAGPADRARIVRAHLGGQIKGDFRASAEYRGFLLETLIREGLQRLSPGQAAGKTR